jgi:hypothetical protein
LLSPTIRVRHLNCCTADGCPVCQGTEALTGGARGAELLGVIQSGVLADFEAPDLPVSMVREVEV